MDHSSSGMSNLGRNNVPTFSPTPSRVFSPQPFSPQPFSPQPFSPQLQPQLNNQSHNNNNSHHNQPFSPQQTFSPPFSPPTFTDLPPFQPETELALNTFTADLQTFALWLRGLTPEQQVAAADVLADALPQRNTRSRIDMVPNRPLSPLLLDSMLSLSLEESLSNSTTTNNNNNNSINNNTSNIQIHHPQPNTNNLKNLTKNTSNNSHNTQKLTPSSGSAPASASASNGPSQLTSLTLLEDIPQWLKTLRLHKYTSSLSNIPWQALVQFDDNELQKRGVSTLGARNKLLKSFAIVCAERKEDIATYNNSNNSNNTK